MKYLFLRVLFPTEVKYASWIVWTVKIFFSNMILCFFLFFGAAKTFKNVKDTFKIASSKDLSIYV